MTREPAPAPTRPDGTPRFGGPRGARLASWGVPDSWRVASVLAYAVVVPTQIWSLARYASSPVAGDLVTFALVSVLAWGWWPLMVSCRVEAWQGGVLVRNALYWHWIPWAHIQSIQAAGALVIELPHHEVVPCSAIERARVNPPRGRQNRVQRVARELEQIRSTTAVDLGGTYRRSPTQPPRWSLVALAVCAAAAALTTLLR